MAKFIPIFFLALAMTVTACASAPSVISAPAPQGEETHEDGAGQGEQ